MILPGEAEALELVRILNTPRLTDKDRKDVTRRLASLFPRNKSPKITPLQEVAKISND